jgi:hypothetical protein
MVVVGVVRIHMDPSTTGMCGCFTPSVKAAGRCALLTRGRKV